ncbi:hypothetical protein [Desulfatibacillum aliphaticivorans]|uniref:hypothetical protein n=1 Tax=Desulfatibacillum aliphaticivorans TaxID=218208 RepID=UPI0010A3DD2A|nr:hypothetical protein [Desulfatibacillum aliphaticivorans]
MQETADAIPLIRLLPPKKCLTFTAANSSIRRLARLALWVLGNLAPVTLVLKMAKLVSFFVLTGLGVPHVFRTRRLLAWKRLKPPPLGGWIYPLVTLVQSP